mmetsp:Transcript_46057/g.121679  ORF Transcript_46057/g.121679 Transcript_46057/m.121679 type:complete len:316 (-) Transcript_46057:86-1033(-)
MPRHGPLPFLWLGLVLVLLQLQLQPLAMVLRVALVTGGNKGVGREIAAKVGRAEGWKVLIGCRSQVLGEVAARELQAAGCDVEFTRLDLTDSATIESTRACLVARYGRLDALVNNAAVCFNDPTLYGKVEHTPFERQASITLNTNFHGTLELTRAMLPLLRASRDAADGTKTAARIVNVASSAGRLSILKSLAIRERVTDPNLQLEQLEDAMREFVSDVEGGVHAAKGWPNTCYGMSKIGIIAMTRVMAREEDGRIMVNSIDPGYCATDQNNNQGHIPAEVGARIPAGLVLLPSSEFVTGKHIYNDGREIDWLAS